MKHNVSFYNFLMMTEYVIYFQELVDTLEFSHAFVWVLSFKPKSHFTFGWLGCELAIISKLSRQNPIIKYVCWKFCGRTIRDENISPFRLSTSRRRILLLYGVIFSIDKSRISKVFQVDVYSFIFNVYKTIMKYEIFVSI